MPVIRGRWSIWVTVIALLVGVLAAIAIWFVPRHTPWYRSQEVWGEETAAPPTTDAAMEARIAAFCGNCHAMPNPANFPRDAWHTEVLRGYEFYARSGMTHLDPPPIFATVDYFRSRAPQKLVFPVVLEATTPLTTTFTRETRIADQHPTVPPGIAHLRWARLQTGGPHELLVCDMRDGTVMALDPNDAAKSPRVLAQLNNPCHAEPCDLDGDGAIDLVVADLGSSVPYDHDLGRVVWLRRDEQNDSYEAIVVASGLGRVADVRPGDMDGDGDDDLVVADFGLHRTGQVLWLENQPSPEGAPRFIPRQIDPRPGAIHVPILDLNGDGRPDFLALISQEYECVEAFMNQKSDDPVQGMTFLRNRVWTGPDLTFGSSGIEPVDLDQDGDMDVLYANGDAFDNNFANPSHGIQWLENLDNQQFAYHRLTDLTGVCRALAGDIDLDGDLDIVASVWLPEQVKPAGLLSPELPSVVCLEQTQPGVFARHTLESGTPNHAAMELADFDADGDLDLAIGSHMASTRDRSHWITIWRNDLK